MRGHYATRRVRGRVEHKRVADRAILAILLLSGIALVFADGSQSSLTASPAWAMSSRSSSTDLALPRFLRSINPRSSSLSLALLPSLRQSPDRAWGGRVGSLDFNRGEVGTGSAAPEHQASAAEPGSTSELPPLEFQIVEEPEPSGGHHSGAITSGFGFRRMGGTVRHHDGIDISLPYGAPIRAHEDGVVTFAGWRNGYGLAVIVDHGAGKETLYAHSSALRVRAGQAVRRGEVIAAVGATGRAYGAHLHFEIRFNGSPVDPEREYLNTHD